MNYKINTFFSKEQCEYLIDFAIKNGEKFSYFKEEENSWDCRRIYDQEYKEYVLNNILRVQSFNDFNIRNINVSLTRYYENRRLDLHLDKTSNYTTVISLTDDYEDGRFVLSSTQCKLDDATTKIHLGLGEGVTFEGNKIYHGVMPVKTGIRCALNIWMNNTDFEYYKLDKEKKLI
jgi:predicted 2-oxoglutarate/Fe(II)-dependent dioxygenase YbiX